MGIGLPEKESWGRRGFTLTEMAVVLFVILLMAAYILPNVAAYLRARQEKDLEGQIARLPAQVVDDATRLHTPVALTVQGNQMVIEETPPQGMQTVNGSQQPFSAGIQILQQLDLGNDLQVTRVQTGGQSADVGTWMWTVYPDGSAEDAGIEFSEGQQTKSLVLQADGDGRWLGGALPDQSPAEWTVGQLEETQQTSSAP